MSGEKGSSTIGQRPALTTTDQAIKDSLIRSMKNKWFYGMLVFLILMIITAVMEFVYDSNHHEDLSGSMLFMVLNLGFSGGMSILAWIYIVKTWKTMKVIQFYNFKKLQRIMIPLVVMVIIGFLAVPMVAIVYEISFQYIVPIGVLLYLWYFIGILALRKRYSGSVIDWYNNMVVVLGQEVQSLNDGFTQRPYSMNILQGSDTKELMPQAARYAQRMLDYILIAGLEKGSDMVVMYIPSPTMISMLANPNSSRMAPDMVQALRHSSKVIVYTDGTLSVNVSQDDYDRIGVPITYHELCQKILMAFGASMKAFFKGDEDRAIELLGGQGYLEKRRKVIKTNNGIALRIGAVVSVALLLLLIGPIQQEFTIVKETTSNYDSRGYISGQRAYDIHPLERPFLLGSDMAMPGDGFRVEFKANRSMPAVRIIISDGMNHEFTFKELLNVQRGVFSFRVPDNYAQSFIHLVFDLYSGKHINMTTLDVKVVQLNGYSNANMAGAILLIGLLVIMEVVLFRKRALARALAENPKQV